MRPSRSSSSSPSRSHRRQQKRSRHLQPRRHPPPLRHPRAPLPRRHRPRSVTLRPTLCRNHVRRHHSTRNSDATPPPEHLGGRGRRNDEQYQCAPVRRLPERQPGRRGAVPGGQGQGTWRPTTSWTSPGHRSTRRTRWRRCNCSRLRAISASMRQKACISRCLGPKADGSDDEGYADAYLFTPRRRPLGRIQVRSHTYVKAPDESD